MSGRSKTWLLLTLGTIGFLALFPPIFHLVRTAYQDKNVVEKLPAGYADDVSRFVIIWLLQQAPIGSVEACHDRPSRRPSASFSRTLPRRKPASSIWQLVVGQMGSLVRDAGTEKPMSW